MASPPRFSSRVRKSLSVAGWTLWLVFLTFYVVAMVPFYSRGLHLLPGAHLVYAGGGYQSHGIPYVVTHAQVYGTGAFASAAGYFLILGPCLLFIVVPGFIWRLFVSWRNYSPAGRLFRLGMLFLTVTVFTAGWRMWGQYFIWELG